MQKSALIITAALASAVPLAAHAGHATESDRLTRLAEVSADPRDGDDVIALRDLRRFTHLELRAREARVDIHGVGLRLGNGQIEWMNVRARLAPGEQRTIELPPSARRADAVVVDYGNPEDRRRDRTPARLELYGSTPLDDRFDRDRSDRDHFDRDDRSDRDDQRWYDSRRGERVSRWSRDRWR